jgi:hypothetical protein
MPRLIAAYFWWGINFYAKNAPESRKKNLKKTKEKD